MNFEENYEKIIMTAHLMSTKLVDIAGGRSPDPVNDAQLVLTVCAAIITADKEQIKHHRKCYQKLLAAELLELLQKEQKKHVEQAKKN